MTSIWGFAGCYRPIADGISLCESWCSIDVDAVEIVARSNAHFVRHRAPTCPKETTRQRSGLAHMVEVSPADGRISRLVFAVSGRQADSVFRPRSRLLWQLIC